MHATMCKVLALQLQLRVGMCAVLPYTCSYMQAFINDVSTALGKPVLPPQSWPTCSGTSSGAAAPPASSSSSNAPESVAQLKDKVLQASKLGYSVDAIVVDKKAEEVNTWRILKFVGDEAELQEEVDGHCGQHVKVHIERLLDDYRIHKGKITAVVNQWCSPLDATWQADAAKAAITLALQAKWREHAECSSPDSIELMTNPIALKAKLRYAKGTLRLVAASQKIEREKPDSSAIPVGKFDIDGKETSFAISSHFVLRASSQSSKSDWVVPFWAVGKCDDEEQPNMECMYEPVEIEVGSINFNVMVPVMSNTGMVKQGELLRWSGQVPQLPAAAGKGKGSGKSKRRKIT